MSWIMGAIVVLFVTNATAIWKWHQTRKLNKTLSASAASFRHWREWYDGYDDRLRREVYLARGGQWPKSWCPTQDTHEMAIELIRDQHKQVQALFAADAPKEDPDYEDYVESLRVELEDAEARDDTTLEQCHEAMFDGESELQNI